jgi:hypothetical protein
LQEQTNLAQRFWGLLSQGVGNIMLVYNDTRKINEIKEENMNLQKER